MTTQPEPVAPSPEQERECHAALTAYVNQLAERERAEHVLIAMPLNDGTYGTVANFAAERGLTLNTTDDDTEDTDADDPTAQLAREERAAIDAIDALGPAEYRDSY